MVVGKIMDRETALHISNLDSYLDTWTDGSGGLHGYIIHHHRDYGILLSPATWQQSVRILANLEIWRKTGDEGWLQKAFIGSRYLTSSYVGEEHLFPDSTTPLTLVNNAWPCLALFQCATELRDAGKSEWGNLSKVGLDCLRESIIPRYWDLSMGDFFFCPPGFRGNRVHTYNQTAVTISVLSSLERLRPGEDYLQRYAIPAADRLVEDQNQGSSPLRGGWGYNDGSSNHLYYYIYTALNVMGLLDIYHATKTDRYLESAVLGGEHLMGMIDPETKLFSHRYVETRGGYELHKYPIMVSASGLGLRQINRLNKLGYGFEIEDSIDALLETQQGHGGFPTFRGITDIWTPEMYPCEPDKTKWRDEVCVPFWTVFVLDMLAGLLPNGSRIPEPDAVQHLVKDTDDGYEIDENRDRVRLLKKGRTVAYFPKKEDHLLYSTEPLRGVPFGAFPNVHVANTKSLSRRIKLGVMGAGGIIIAETLILLYMLLT